MRRGQRRPLERCDPTMGPCWLARECNCWAAGRSEWPSSFFREGPTLASERSDPMEAGRMVHQADDDGLIKKVFKEFNAIQGGATRRQSAITRTRKHAWPAYVRSPQSLRPACAESTRSCGAPSLTPPHRSAVLHKRPHRKFHECGKATPRAKPVFADAPLTAEQSCRPNRYTTRAHRWRVASAAAAGALYACSPQP